MSKGERISQLVRELEAESDGADPADISRHPNYRAFFRCWNEQRYYEAHDVLEHLWLQTTSDDTKYFKGLIQAAGAFVHLQKHFEQPTHPKHGRRLSPAVRLFRLAEKNLEPFLPHRHAFDVQTFRGLLAELEKKIVDSDYKKNPWSPETAPKLELSAGEK